VFVQYTFVYPASLFLHTILSVPSSSISWVPSFGLFLRVRPFPPASTRRSMLSYPTDNSIILHAKTASDVLAQSASHLCEQITSYRKTDFIFEERWFRFFLLARATQPSSPVLSLAFFLFFLLVLLCIVYSGGQDWHD